MPQTWKMKASDHTDKNCAPALLLEICASTKNAEKIKQSVKASPETLKKKKAFVHTDKDYA